VFGSTGALLDIKPTAGPFQLKPIVRIPKSPRNLAC
jgi:hypothetical protein